jgi:sugar lactone lactonase YvrE
MSSGINRSGGATILLGLCWLLAAAACGDDTNTGGTGGGGGPTGGGGEQAGGDGGGGNGPGGGGMGGMGGMGGTAAGGGGAGPTSVAVVSEGRVVFDAAPSPNADAIYFTGLEANGTPGIFEGSPAGGATVVVTGSPLTAPFGIATSTSGETLYVADSAADEAGADRGGIFTVPAAGGTPTLVPGTAGLSPRNLEVRNENNVDQLYFTGRSASGSAAIYKIASGGGTATALIEDGLVDPSGIAVASNGDLYVVDTIGSGRANARVLFLASGSTTPTSIVDSYDAGFPAGAALSLDESELWLSALDAATLTTAALVVDTTSFDTTVFTGDAANDLSSNFEPGGIHRAKDVDAFGWVDARAANGTVYLITK